MSLPRKRVVLIVVIAVAVFLYAGFNLWVFRYARSGKPQETYKGLTLPKQGDTLTETVSETPTPRPTGPGQYACSPEGICNLYGKEQRAQYCTTTYADSFCLDQCGNKNNLCTK